MDLEKYLRKRERMLAGKEEELRLSIDGEVFEFEKLTDDKYAKIQNRLVAVNQEDDEDDERENNGKNNIEKDDLIKICRDVIFYSCPEIRSEELRKELGITYPPDVIKAIFSNAEIGAVGSELMKFNGMTESVKDIVKKV